MARPVRDQLHLLPQPGHVRPRGAGGRRRRAAALVGGGGERARAGARLRAADRRSPSRASTTGFSGQVAMRATLGFWGARGLSSPYRVVAATYWFAAQALAGALGIQAVVVALGRRASRRSSRSRSASRVFHAALAVLGFDVMRYVLRVVLPLSLAFTGVLARPVRHHGRPAFAVGRVFDSPDQHLTWVGFATLVTVMCGRVADARDEHRRLLPLHADASRHADRPLRPPPTRAVAGRRPSSAATPPSPPARLNPFVAVADLTSMRRAARAPARRDRRPGHRRQHQNVYTAGLSLVNAIPALGRLRATAARRPAAAIALSARSRTSSRTRRAGSSTSATSPRRSPA